jgi:class 3 adenylate cyclase
MRVGLCPTQIGRDQQVAAIGQACELIAAGGRGAMIVVSGEAGVGKSRLAAAARELADRRGLRVMVGECRTDDDGAYGPFVSALRRRIRTLDDDGLVELFAPPATLAAALVPEIAPVVGLPSTMPSFDDLAVAFWQLLRRLSRAGGTLLLLEDVHWADSDSLRMLTYLAREVADLPVLLVVTYRSDELHRRHPLQAVLAELGRERRYSEVKLEPLDRIQVRQMLEAIFDGTTVGDDFTDVVVERSGGNPLFVEELMSVLVDRGDIYLEAGDWARRDLAAIEMPQSVRETLLARTRELHPEVVRVLQLAAVAGDRLDLAVLAAAANTTPARVDDAVRDGLRLQILIERHDGGLTSYGFRHALTREALSDDLVGPDRQSARRSIAEAIVAVHDGDLDSRAAELADHFADAGDAPSTVRFGVIAARRASGAFAKDEAGRQWERVIKLTSNELATRLDFLIEAANTLMDAADPRLGVAFATEARALARSTGDPLREAAAIRALENQRWLAGDGLAAVALSQDAFAAVHGHDDYAEATALRNLTRRLTLVDRGDEAHELIAAGIELAERSGNLSALSGLHGTRMLMSPFGPTYDSAYSASLQAAVSAGDVDAERNVRINSGYCSIWAGALGRASEDLARASELTRRVAPNDGYVAAGYSWQLALAADFPASSEMAEPLRSATDVPTRTVALTALYEVASRRGDPLSGRLADELCELALRTGENQRIAPALAARARELLRTQGIEAAAPVFWEALETTTYAVKREGSHWLFSPDFAAGLAREGLAERLDAWVDGIIRFTGNDDNPHNVAALRLCEAHQAAAHNDFAGARPLFGEAIDRYHVMPCPAREVEALLGLADLEWRADRLDASEVAAREAVTIASRIGATTLVDAATAALSSAEVVPVLATVMVTDIVGSTAKAAALGDRGWRELLERHHAIVRRELSRLGGREIDTAGDGFLAAFASPAQAIRCAASCRDKLTQIELPVRIGLHTGECQQSGDKLTGIAVHIAARVAASAVAGQILVSRTVCDLVAGSGFQFVDEGTREFKGVPDVWRVFALDR